MDAPFSKSMFSTESPPGGSTSLINRTFEIENSVDSWMITTLGPYFCLQVPAVGTYTLFVGFGSAVDLEPAVEVQLPPGGPNRPIPPVFFRFVYLLADQNLEVCNVQVIRFVGGDFAGSKRFLNLSNPNFLPPFPI